VAFPSEDVEELQHHTMPADDSPQPSYGVLRTSIDSKTIHNGELLVDSKHAAYLV
jgi:hypothetical protein